jgi:ElaB/YqjD/DUF883 family membrane-anchored ribosome-binding protein
MAVAVAPSISKTLRRLVAPDTIRTFPLGMPRRHRPRSGQEIKMDKLGRLDELIDGAEELLIQLADAHDPNIQRLRDRVDRAIADATRTLSRQDDEASLRLRDIANSIDDYVRDYPWLALLTGVLVAGTAAFIAGAAVGSERRS